MRPFDMIKNALLLTFPLFFILTCSKNDNVISPLIDGNIVGKIRNSDGTPAKGISIRLVPADFDPRPAAAAARIDSTETDQNGMYSFTLASSGFFNISAQGMGTYCFQDSVYGSERDQFRVKDDTLKAPGSITGIARLRPGADSKQIIILVLGTNTYGTPSDASGAFTLSPLAQARYCLRFLTLEKDYGIFDTMVSVESGKTTSLLGVLQLPFRGLPAIGPVSAQYDPHSMFVTLTWPACDTSNIDCIYIFRNTGIEQALYAIVNKTDTSFSEDLAMLSSSMYDTLRYSIAAVGKGMAIGRVSVAPGFLPTSIVKRIDAVSLSGLAMNLYGNFGDFTVDGNHNIYLCGDGWIAKIDSLGQASLGYCDGYSPPDISSWVTSASSIRTGYGKVYYYSPRDSLLVKFSPDLKPVAKQTLLCGNIAVNTQGSVYTFFNVAKFSDKPDAFSIKIFDSTLFMVDSVPMLSSVTDEIFWLQQVLGDTVVFLRSDAPMKVYKTSDILFNQIQTVDIGEKIDRRYLPEPIVISQVAYGSNGESVIGFWKGGVLPECGKILCILDARNQLIGRFFLSYKDLFGGYVFDGIDRIYLCNYGSQSIEILTLNSTM